MKVLVFQDRFVKENSGHICSIPIDSPNVYVIKWIFLMVDTHFSLFHVLRPCCSGICIKNFSKKRVLHYHKFHRICKASACEKCRKSSTARIIKNISFLLPPWITLSFFFSKIFDSMKPIIHFHSIQSFLTL